MTRKFMDRDTLVLDRSYCVLKVIKSWYQTRCCRRSKYQRCRSLIFDNRYINSAHSTSSISNFMKRGKARALCNFLKFEHAQVSGRMGFLWLGGKHVFGTNILLGSTSRFSRLLGDAIDFLNTQKKRDRRQKTSFDRGVFFPFIDKRTRVSEDQEHFSLSNQECSGRVRTNSVFLRQLKCIHDRIAFSKRSEIRRQEVHQKTEHRFDQITYLPRPLSGYNEKKK